jgi:enoyl-CoA hydratase/carnithine racemase
MAEFVSVDVSDGVATITLDRPPMNPLSFQVQREIKDAAEEVGGRQDVGAVVLHGGPNVFAAGADIKEMVDMTYQDMVRASVGLQGAFDAVAAIPQPTIAAITGYALGGGCELALCCDLRIAADDAKLGQPEIRLGLIPGAGGTQRLPRLVGISRAKEIIFTGRFVDAEEALAIGLVNRVVPADAVYRTAAELAVRLARGPALAMRAAKQAIDSGLDADLATGLAIERLHFSGLFATEDRAIGMASFVEHGPGKAVFTGR